jgi:hypothetical protein
MSRPMTASALCSLVLAALVLAVLPATALSSPAQAAVPSKSRWLADVNRAMAGSRVYVNRTVARGGTRLAVNLDIDNTSLASHYDYGTPVRVVLRFARHARAHGVVLLFNTGRVRGDGRLVHARRELARVGSVVTELCGRTSSAESLTHGKQRCRRHFVAEGYTLIANVGNRRTDFLGGNYRRAFRLPSYHNALG